MNYPIFYHCGRFLIYLIVDNQLYVLIYLLNISIRWSHFIHVCFNRNQIQVNQASSYLFYRQRHIRKSSIKYSPSIQPYTIAQSSYLKFRLNNLDHFLNEYSSKLFKLNKFEYYIYDPDGNLLHLHLCDLLNIKYTDELVHTKPIIHTNDSGVGESSDPPTTQFFSSTVPQGYRPFYPIDTNKQGQTVMSNAADIDVQSHSSQSSHDSGRWSSLSSNEMHSGNRLKRTVHQIPITIMNSTSALAAAAKQSENQLEEAIQNYRLKQQKRSGLLHNQ